MLKNPTLFTFWNLQKHYCNFCCCCCCYSPPVALSYLADLIYSSKKRCSFLLTFHGEWLNATKNSKKIYSLPWASSLKLVGLTVWNIVQTLEEKTQCMLGCDTCCFCMLTEDPRARMKILSFQKLLLSTPDLFISNRNVCQRVKFTWNHHSSED